MLHPQNPALRLASVDIATISPVSLSVRILFAMSLKSSTTAESEPKPNTTISAVAHKGNSPGAAITGGRIGGGGGRTSFMSK